MGKIQDMGGEAVALPIKFGTDGIRGESYKDITPGLAENFGAATVQATGVDTVVIGRDTRASGEELSAAAMRGIIRAGANVIDLSVLPTPGVAYIARKIGAAGVVVTASHNTYSPKPYNGLKMFSPDGTKPDEDTTRKVEYLLNFSGGLEIAEQRGKVLWHEASRLRRSYENFLVESVDADLLKGVRVVTDAANGAAFGVSANVIARLGGRVYPVAGAPNGININDGCGATAPERGMAAINRFDADVAFFFDGDADRGLIGTKKGRMIDGDGMLLINALAAKQRGELMNNTAVGTVMSNMGTEMAFREHGINFVRSKVGDTEVARMMAETGAIIGGEQSGHVIIAKHLNTGDGLLAILQTMQSLRELDMTPDEAAELIREYPQVQLKTEVPAAVKDTLVDHPEVVAGMKGFEDDLAIRGLTGRVLIRPSGTEPVMRVMVEVEPGKDDEQKHANAQLARESAGHLLKLVASAAQ